VERGELSAQKVLQKRQKNTKFQHGEEEKGKSSTAAVSERRVAVPEAKHPNRPARKVLSGG